MRTNRIDALSQPAMLVSVVLAILSPVFAQENSVAKYKVDPVEFSPAVGAGLPETPVAHKFWDRENTALFATVAAFSAADFVVTRDNLSHGGRELNPLTRPFAGSTAGLAANFAGETAGVIGVSYFFHKTGHHKLERLTPLINFGASAFAVGYGLAHR
jgi:hypothetical protein